MQPEEAEKEEACAGGTQLQYEEEVRRSNRYHLPEPWSSSICRLYSQEAEFILLNCHLYYLSANNKVYVGLHVCEVQEHESSYMSRYDNPKNLLNKIVPWEFSRTPCSFANSWSLFGTNMLQPMIELPVITYTESSIA